MKWRDGNARPQSFRAFLPIEDLNWPDLRLEELGRLTLEAWAGFYLALGELCRLAGAELPVGFPERLRTVLPERIRLQNAEDWKLLGEIFLFHENLLLSRTPAELPFWLVEDPPGLRADLEEAGFLGRADEDNL